MSANFNGVTFAQQKVSPSDDAVIRRVILSDGVLVGCGLSYSGSTLTMAAGQILICGRQVSHPAAQNWAVVDATSGYARLVLTVDLTRTSTKDAFDQVQDSIEYASSVDGFQDLTQQDINASGTKYQIVVCVVSLGTGGISGIVSQLDACAVRVDAAITADQLPIIPMTKGGTGATNGAAGLANLFSAGPTILSSYQYGDSLPAAGTKGRIFFKKVSS